MEGVIGGREKRVKDNKIMKMDIYDDHWGRGLPLGEGLTMQLHQEATKTAVQLAAVHA